MARSADVPDNGMHRADAAGVPVLLVRLGGTVYAIAATCSHAGGPLDEGSLEEGVVTCPWHGSRFNIRNGAVRDGPATFRQPSYAVREEGGRISVKAVAPH